MADLSSEAQAVLDAVCANTEPDCDTQHLIAAALRVAADQAENVHPANPSTEWGEGWLEGVQDVVAGFRRIATELENNG